MRLCKNQHRKLLLEYIPMAFTAVGVLVCAFLFQQKFIKVLPLFFSLLILLLNARANRLGFLLGALNSMIYIIGYFMEGVYGTLLSTVFGIIMMLIAYFRWKKNSYGQATIFRTFGNKQRMILSVLLLLAWGICSFVLWKMDGTAVVLDGLALVLGVVVPVLNIAAYVESALLNVISAIAQLVMWGQIILIDGNTANWTYLIFAVYTLHMTVQTFLRWLSLYREQQALTKSEDE